MPVRIQLSRRKGFRLPDGAVNVARPSKFGNPFRVVPAKRGGVDGPTDCFVVMAPGDRHFGSHDDKAAATLEAIALYRELFTLHVVADGAMGAERVRAEAGKMNLRMALELRGKDLACWCPLDQPCHADVLLQVANA